MMSSLADDTRWLDATAQAELVASGKVTPLEMVNAAIERVERYDGALNALTYRWFEAARELASSNTLPDGPFRGVPYLLKDLYAAEAGKPLSNGSKAYKAADYVSSEDTTLVSRYKAAGLISIGRSNSPEFGSVPVTEPEAWGPTRNPWDLSRTPGGSSGGSASAVAAGIVPIAHASDGGGSIRIHDKHIQATMLRHLGFTEEEAKAQFGFLMDAFEYGAPPHGGLAFGLDRLVAILGGQETIRDFIAFPKNNSGRDVMIDAPAFLDEHQLKELSLKSDIQA